MNPEEGKASSENKEKYEDDENTDGLESTARFREDFEVKADVRP